MRLRRQQLLPCRFCKLHSPIHCAWEKTSQAQSRNRKAPRLLIGLTSSLHKVETPRKRPPPLSNHHRTQILTIRINNSSGRLSSSCQKSQSVYIPITFLLHPNFRLLQIQLGLLFLQVQSLTQRLTAGVRTNVQDLLKYSLDEKKRNFLETVELQIGLKNYDPQRDSMNFSTSNLPVRANGEPRCIRMTKAC